ncbi:hypothetical protein GH890_31935, partial [Bacillus thuringiensis]|nr:hypothetical protein [Bacillus thuringiensis]
DECSSDPCQNGATCSTPDFNSFSCQCLPRFAGHSCEKKTIRYYGQFRLPGMTYVESLNNKESDEYKILARNVTNELTRIYKQ